MDKQQLVIVTLAGNEPVSLPDTRYMLREDRTGEYVIVVAPVTVDDLLARDPAQAYGTVRVITDNGVEIVSTLGLGLLVVPAQ